eukprot:CAMPEP_0176214864 /NCGR_PEP_ID=MMETSP0121_2-20121125/16388_1 /TAXON_ID=160619 /ORGANISM="Kryptoperidinium foliaceum, Strain CCMP 1326" /LENGTH=203 /DNA_ID=CAMNT_0017553959 /DNA_START=1 /DNA_END=612 /DNA_ORIENTATION=+
MPSGSLLGVVALLLQHVCASATFRVQFDVVTTQGPGSFVIKVDESWAPAGAARFKELVEAKFYDDTRFFRVIPTFMVQFGISGDPKISAAWESKTIKDDAVKMSNKVGFVTFAMTGEPNSRTTQLFINYVDNARLDEMGFAPFGEVEANGMDVVRQIFDCGESPDQQRIETEGNSYLDKDFGGRLSKIVATKVLPEDEHRQFL